MKIELDQSEVKSLSRLAGGTTVVILITILCFRLAMVWIDYNARIEIAKIGLEQSEKLAQRGKK